MSDRAEGVIGVARLKYLWRNLRLKHRLILLNFALIILATGIVTTVILKHSKEVIEENAIMLMNNSLGQVVYSIEEMLKGQLYDISQFVMYDQDIHYYLNRHKEKEKQGDYNKDVDTYLIREKVLKQYYMQRSEELKMAAIIDRDNQLHNISYPARDEGSVMLWLEDIFPRKANIDLSIEWYPLVENYFTSLDKGEVRLNNVVVANRQIVTTITGKYIGQQLYTFNEQSIYQKYKNSNILDTGQILIVDEKGRLVSHSEEQKVVSKSLKDEEEILKKVLGKKQDTFFISNNKQIVISKRLNHDKWVLIAILPEKTIYRDINKTIFIYIMLTICVLLLAGAVLIMLANRIVNPIKTIIKSMDEVEKDNLDVMVDVKGYYEVRKLAKYYNSMIRRINKLIEEEYILEKNKKTAEFNALMSQINPHFLYNTLESIIWQARSIGAEEISHMAYSLGKFFRISVNKGSHIVTVEEELSHVQAYVNIQKIRYKDAFDLIIDVEKESISSYKILKLILQPIVENAIIHGFCGMEDKGYIIISIFEKQETLIIEVEDNGKGMSLEQLQRLRDSMAIEDDDVDTKISQTGIGMKNVDNRIKLYFGEDYGVKISSDDNKGTKVTINIPYIDELGKNTP